MNLRTLLVRAGVLSFMSLVLVAGCGGDDEDSAPADEPNIGPGAPPGTPPKGATPTKTPLKK